MPRLQIASDLHLEFYPSPEAVESLCHSMFTDADVLVLAGDIGLLNPDMEAARVQLELAMVLFCRHYDQVIWVPGNHEFYYYNFADAVEVLEGFKRLYPNLHTSVEPFSVPLTNNVDIHGTTLWFEPDPSHVAWDRMTDAYIIGETSSPPKSRLHYRGHKKPTTPVSFEQRGQAAVAYLEQHVKPSDIVVTHHLPLWSVVLPQFKNDALTHFFVNEDAHKVVSDNRPSLWVCGHTHGSIDTVVGDTRIVCNPHGYLGRSVNKVFKQQLIIEV
jgi:Icc-related predicted phosphoesterase